MLKNYLKTTLKSLRHHKTFSFINLAGLTIGLCVSFFALLYVGFELSYDAYHEHADHIYRVVTDVKTAVGTEYKSSSAPMAPAIRETFPEVEAATRILLDYLIVQKDQGSFSEERIAYADSTLFTVFSFPMVSGDPEKVLNAPFHVVLSESTARKYFGSSDPVGNTLLINGKDEAYITGVMKDMPYNAHFRVDMLVSMATLLTAWNPSMERNWTNFRFYTYLLLPENCDPLQLSAKFPDLVKKHIDHSEREYTLTLEPLKSVYLYRDPRGHRAGSSVSGNVNNVYIFALTAAFVLFIACFNFINLTTAFSMHRAREIGVRKVLGASRPALIFQFTTDAVLFSLIAFIFALTLSSALLPLFNQLTGKTISTGIFEHPDLIALLLLISLGTGVLSGIYPAFFLSGFQPKNVLKGRFISGAKGMWLRKTLVVAQFSISVILIIATMVVFLQLDFMRNHELGFKKDHMMVIDFQFDDRVGGHQEIIKQELRKVPGVDMVSISSCIPGRANHEFTSKIENGEGVFQELESDAYFIDFDFLKQYGIEVIAGRPFSDQFAFDSIGGWSSTKLRRAPSGLCALKML